MYELLAKLHTVDVDAIGLGDYGLRRNTNELSTGKKFSPYVTRQIKTWTTQYRATETDPIQDMEILIAELAACLPMNSEKVSCLVHGDFRIDNMIFDTDSSQVNALLDWELSTLGDSMADVAYNFMIYYFSPSNPFLKGVYGAIPEGIPSLPQALEHYSNHLNIYSKGLATPPTLTDLDYYLAFSFFRCSAILQGVYKRSMLGNASASNASNALVFAKETARLGADALARYKRHVGNGPVTGSAFHSTRPSNATHQAYTSRIPLVFDPLISSKAKSLLRQSTAFLSDKFLPIEQKIAREIGSSPDKWVKIHPTLESLKGEAKALGLWNMFLPKDSDTGSFGAGLTNLEYAPIAELTGYVSPLAAELFNCNAPDTGNMEILARYGTPAQQEKWLRPLLAGEMRSCFAMTEPEVASSDATNMQATIERRGDRLVLNGRKWWISGATDPRCGLCIFMGRRVDTTEGISAHQRHSMVLVPMDTPGITIVRPMLVLGYDDAPDGHAEMVFENVQVEVGQGTGDGFILGEGRGFEVAQGRLGPGRIHHCMRLIGTQECFYTAMYLFDVMSRLPFRDGRASVTANV